MLYFTYIRGLGADEDRYIRSHDGRTLTPNMVMFKLKKKRRSNVNLKTFMLPLKKTGRLKTIKFTSVPASACACNLKGLHKFFINRVVPG